MSSQTTHHPRTPPHTHNRHAEAPQTVIIQSQPQHQQHPFRAPRRGDSYNYTHPPHNTQPGLECSATQIGLYWGVNKLSGGPHTSEFLENTRNCWPVGPLKILTKIFQHSGIWAQQGASLRVIAGMAAHSHLWRLHPRFTRGSKKKGVYCTACAVNPFNVYSQISIRP